MENITKSNSSSIEKQQPESFSSDQQQHVMNSNEFVEQCCICLRSFKSKEHYEKHRRGALCRRLVQKVARKHRKLALKAKTGQNDEYGTGNTASKQTKKKSRKAGTASSVFKPYQCNICSARFYDKVNVELHLEREHNTNQQLWSEVSKETNDRNSDAGTNISYAPHSYAATSGSNANLNNCINMNTQYYNSNRQKCMECNAMFNSLNDLAEHRRISHNNSMELNTIQNRNLNPYMNNSMSNNCHPDSSVNQSIENKNIVSINNMNVPNQPPQYVFPQNYYNNTDSIHHQQQAIINANPPQYHQINQAQLPNNQLQHHNPNVIPQQPLLHPHQQQDPNIIHQNSVPQPQHSYTPSYNSMPVPTVGQREETNTQILHVTVPMNTPDSSFILTTSNSNVSPVDASQSSSNCEQQRPPPEAPFCGGPVSTEDSTAPQSPTTSKPSLTSAPSSKSMYFQPTAAAPLESASKWNMCAECGVKFLDVMNLELHVERKHPEVFILDSIALTEGTVCFKTGKVTHKVGSMSAEAIRQLVAEGKFVQKHSCILCQHKTKSLSMMADHVKNTHNLSGKSLIDSIISSGESNETIDVNKLKGKESETPIKIKRVGNSPRSRKRDNANQCHSCLKVFKTSSEVIRHSIKDKIHTCAVCCFVTCSKHELFDHVKAEHQNFSDFNKITVEDRNSAEKRRITCFQCGKKFRKTGDLLDHLETHGSMIGKCEKCGKQDYSIATILIHMTTLHPHFINKIKITLFMKGTTVSAVYMQAVSGDLLDTPEIANKVFKSKMIVLSKSNHRNHSEQPGPSSNQSEDVKVFACSECCICFSSVPALENHFKQHQTNKKVSEHSSIDKMALKALPITQCFKCELCGFLMENKSNVVVDHIKRMHISGNMIHVVNQDEASKKEHVITVVTPVSSTS